MNRAVTHSNVPQPGRSQPLAFPAKRASEWPQASRRSARDRSATATHRVNGTHSRAVDLLSPRRAVSNSLTCWAQRRRQRRSATAAQRSGSNAQRRVSECSHAMTPESRSSSCRRLCWQRPAMRQRALSPSIRTSRRLRKPSSSQGSPPYGGTVVVPGRAVEEADRDQTERQPHGA